MPRLFHVTSSLNRASIERSGLDWRLMGAAPGVAGSRSPEAEGTYLCDREEVEWFAEMAISSGHACVDVWTVSLPPDAAFVLDTLTNYEYHPDPIPPSAILLVRSDWSPKSRFEG